MANDGKIPNICRLIGFHRAGSSRMVIAEGDYEQARPKWPTNVFPIRPVALSPAFRPRGSAGIPAGKFSGLHAGKDAGAPRFKAQLTSRARKCSLSISLANP